MGLKFIDLFAGLGGFHLALQKLGHECVFASELKEDLQRPKYVLLENVSNLSGHDGGDTMKVILRELRGLDYDVPDPEILSPHQFGIPQHRRRVYIVAADKR